MADVIVYVDGFNLYYGSLKRTPYKWLDLGRLCAGMLPNDHVIAIKYYTARTTSRSTCGRFGRSPTCPSRTATS